MLPTMTLGERILLRLSRPPEQVAAWQEEKPQASLATTRRLFPDFLDRVSGKRVLDYGCGFAHEARALAEHAARVVGLDSNADVLARANALTRDHPLAERIHLLGSAEGLEGRFDIVYSQNAMEHFPDPVGELARMRRLLAPGGSIFLHFATPWLSPYGSHMHFFCPVPWLNVLFSETTVMWVRSRFRDDGAQRYEEVEGGLNRMTVAKFDRCVREAGLRYRRTTLYAVKGLPLVTRVPGLRELLTNRVAAVLEPIDAEGAAPAS